MIYLFNERVISSWNEEYIPPYIKMDKSWKKVEQKMCRIAIVSYCDLKLKSCEIIQ